MTAFAQRLLAWWEQHGRHDLPWQQSRTPYRVWLAEVMLQQTQVTTVIPYYQRFLSHFPDLASLAAASEDDVLAQWSGLGYYSRGRNLHRTARVCQDHYAGELPADAETLSALPGIGASTANAIVSQAHDQVLPILDGNVKRVMARHAGVAGWPGESRVQKVLWQAATERLPKTRGADYTQAIMDLGATLCTARKPRCADCPVSTDCHAANNDRVHELPGRKPSKTLPLRSAVFICLHDADQRLWLQRRPGQGIWAGLWCLPQFDDVAAAQAWLAAQGLELEPSSPWARFKHGFTHYKLQAEVWRLQPNAHQLRYLNNRIADEGSDWFTLAEALAKGIPQPIRRLLEQQTQSDLI